MTSLVIRADEICNDSNPDRPEDLKRGSKTRLTIVDGPEF